MYEDDRQAKKQMQEYGIIKKNVDSILYPSPNRARSRNGKAKVLKLKNKLTFIRSLRYTIRMKVGELFEEKHD